MQSFSSWPSCFRFFARARSAPATPSATASSASCATATKRSPARGARPSFYLLACSLLLLAAGVTSLFGSGGPEAGDEAALLARSWRPLDASLPCPPGDGYYELESDDASFEAYRAPSGTVLASRPPPGGDSYRCRAVSGPHFIQEIP